MPENYHNKLLVLFKEKTQYEHSKEAVYQTMKEAIISKIIPVGTALYSSHLSKLFYLSRTPVEQALTRLYNEKLITSSPTNGYFTYQLNFKESRDSNEFMLLLYLNANLLANSKLDPYYSNLLEKKLSTLNSIEGFKEYIFEENSFHLLLAESTGNENLFFTLKKETQKSSLINFNYADNEMTKKFMIEHTQLDQELLRVIKNGSLDDVYKKSIQHNQHMMNFVLNNLFDYQ